MKSLTNLRSAAILAILCASCSTAGELNLAFRTDRNQLVLHQLRIAGHHGRFVAGTATDKTLVDVAFAERHGLVPGDSPVLMQPGALDHVSPGLADFSGEIDAIVGRDLLGPVAVIDFRNQLITRFSHIPETSGRRPFHWSENPSYPLTIDGARHVGVVDTAVPDSLLVPRRLLEGRECTRCRVNLEIGGLRLDGIEVRSADVDVIRIGNRILQHFLVTIDYRNRTTSLEWQ